MEKEKSPKWILRFVLIQLFLLGNAHPDFISIDCGASSEYNDPQTGISYQTDIGFVETGRNTMVAYEERSEVDFALFGRQLQTLRSFPEGKRNCYTLKPKQAKNNNYLIRAFFAYENYDAKNQTPSFDLYLNVDFWTTVDLDYTDAFQYSEIIHTPKTDTIHVCLINTGRGTPFISTLELRPLTNSIYNLTPSPSQSLLVIDTRVDVGSFKLTSSLFKRFKDDVYDRVWRVDDMFEDKGLRKFNSSSEDIDVGSTNDSYELPTEVLMSATKSLNLSFDLSLDYDDVWKTQREKSFRYYVIFHFVEIEKLPAGQKRVIDIIVNDEYINAEPITLEYLKPVTVTSVTNQDGLRFNISATSESDAPPILNAIETYKIISPLASPTDQTDADAILDIKNTYGIPKVDWQGDPCVPEDFRWEGLGCIYDDSNSANARITSLNLSASKLRGQIVPSFSQMTELKSLDLSSNDLSGSIPEFLAKLPNLTILNLSGNKLTGSVPKVLKEKSELEMRLDDNPSLCWRDPCQKHKFLIPLIASVSALTVVIILISLGIWIFKMKKLKVSTKQNALELRNRAYSYTDVLEITHNLQHLIGEGGFGKVYLGTLKNCTQVAVKLLSHSSVQGHREFRSEVELLMVIHHRHLVSLIGYCEESDVRALIYEYMPNGNLQHHLSSNKGGALKWKDRLQIALEAAYGLDYLHNGCKPAIVHRDLKASNILLDKNMEVKIADFGLSRSFANDIDTHLSTRPAGTIGYLDPQFQNSGNLTKGSDVYSFGIVLLELLTGKPSAKRRPNNTFTLLLEWVTPKLGSKDDIKSIIDPRLQGQYNVDSALKFVEVAKSCTRPLAIQRPDISQVVVELRECLAMEIRIEGTSQNTNSSSSLDMSTLQFDSSFSTPSAR
ncbi:hypothetical protein K1719_046158 [Acacia pycnantha]|nr:hypothetical protein K1719_046158 [Acacia pycnantha]